MTSLTSLLEDLRCRARTEREKGAYLEHLTRVHLQHEPMYRERYSIEGAWL